MDYIKVLSRIEQINYYIGLSLNVILINLIIFATKADIGAYKYLQLTFVLNDIVYASYSYFMQIKMITKGHAFAFFLLSFDGGNLYLVALFGGLFSLILVIVSFNFLYRYWAVVSPHLVKLFSTAWFPFVLFLFTLTEFVVWYSSCFFLYLATPEVRVDIVPEMACKYGLDALTHPMVVGDYWRDGHHNWRPMSGLAVFSTIIAAGFAFMIFSSFSILRRLGTAKAMSAKTKRMQYALFRMLAVQTAIPLILVHGDSSQAIILPLFGITFSCDSCPTVISFFPPLDALAVILLMRDYRETMKSLITRSMSSLVEIPLPKKRQNDKDYLSAFEEYKTVVAPFLQCATFKRAFPIIFAAVPADMNVDQLKVQTEELRRRITHYMKGKIDVGPYKKVLHVKTDDNLDEISCLHWNCCGLVGQTARTKDSSLLDLIIALEPDIILLNEVKAKEEDIQAVVRGLEWYAYLSVPSSAPKGRSMRGSVIIYRICYKFKILPVGQEVRGEDREAPAIEAIAADVQTSQGKRYRLITSYVRGDGEHFDEAEEVFNKLANGATTIVAGDLNMKKEKFVSKWKQAGYTDSLNPAWSTNKQKNSFTSIDYVMHNGKTAPLVCHRPIQPDNDSVHFPIPFTLGRSSSGGFCTDAACMFGCGK